MPLYHRRRIHVFGHTTAAGRWNGNVCAREHQENYVNARVATNACSRCVTYRGRDVLDGVILGWLHLYLKMQAVFLENRYAKKLFSSHVK